MARTSPPGSMRVPVVLALAALIAIGAGCSSGSSSSDGGGGSGGGGGSSGTSCGDAACGAAQVCVRTQTLGGAQNCPGDGGTCPQGYELVGGCCVMTPVWNCVARPAGCGASVTCACATGTLCMSGQVCSMPRDNQIDCTLLAP
jgi:hypothetical protein